MMKNTFLVLIALGLFGCNKSNHYVIKGYVQDKDSGVVALGQLGESMFDPPEYHLSNGEFYFEGKIDHPEDFMLFYQESESSRPIRFSIFIEPSAKVNVILYPDSISKSVIKGSKIAIEFWEANEVIAKKYLSELNNLKIDYQNAIDKENIEQQNIILNKGDSLSNEIRNWKLGYIKNNPSSFISAYYLFSDHLHSNEDTIKKYYEILDASLSESKYTKEIKSFLSVLPGNPFQDFELYDANKKLYKLSAIAKDKVILLDFWASWCQPCRVQNVKLGSLYDNYRSKGFEIVGVSIDRDTAAVINTIAKDKMTWINLIDRSDETAVSKMYRHFDVPFSVLIDNNGIIIDRGVIEIERLESVIDSLLIN
jgi:peroxiredoxin